MDELLSALYRSDPSSLETLAADDDETPPPIPDKYLRKAYGVVLDMQGVTPETLSNPKVIAYVRQVNKRLSAPIDRVSLSDKAAQRLREDVYIFSGFHTYHELKEASERMIGKDGKIKDFETYYRDTKQVRDKYNKSYLRAEYNYARRAAESSAKWEEAKAGKDSYDLMYRTAGDSKVRPEHAALDGIVLPVDDPFWDEAYPPNGWNCRCTAIKVPKGTHSTDNSDRCLKTFREMTTGRDEMWRCNTARQGVIFPRKHPYYSKRGIDHCSNPKLAADLGKDEECKVLANLKPKPLHVPKKILIETTKGGHTIHRYDNVDPEASDYQQVLSAARYFAANGEDVEILPNMQRGKEAFAYEEIYADLIGTQYDGKTPDMRCSKNGVSIYREVKGYKDGADGRRALKNMLNRALEQSSRIIIQQHPDWTEHYLNQAIRVRILQGKNIEEVWTQEGKDVVLVYKKAED